MRILITGGAGFVGSRLALLYRSKYPNADIVVFDNLKRRGSELNLSHFKIHNINFIHGDIRQTSDFDDLKGRFDLMVEASAEPSVLSGTQGDSPLYAIQTNLFGTINCLEFARKNCGIFLFLSTSRVYSIKGLLALPLQEDSSRFVLDSEKAQNIQKRGLGAFGIAETFPTDSFRSFYGTSKLSSEFFIQEYVENYKLNAIINRCGVIAGAGQFGKVDQGVFTLWIVNHYFKKMMKFTGFQGTGKQVRDLLHPSDLFQLLELQVEKVHQCSGDIFNIGGGHAISTSLLEWTAIAQEVTGNKIEVQKNAETTNVDIPYYVSDYSKAATQFEWQPKVKIKEIAEEIAAWVKMNENTLRGIFN